MPFIVTEQTVQFFLALLRLDVVCTSNLIWRPRSLCLFREKLRKVCLPAGPPDLLSDAVLCRRPFGLAKYRPVPALLAATRLWLRFGTHLPLDKPLRVLLQAT